MLCQVVSARSKINPLSGETLFLFWSLADSHQRRLLVDGMGNIWMDAGGRAVRIGSNNKYFAVCAAILKARAN